LYAYTLNATKKNIIHDDGLSMKRETPVSQKHPSTSQPVSRRRNRLYVVAVVTAIASTIVLALFFAGFLTLGANVEITTSTLRTGIGLSSNSTYRWVAVDVGLYNPGWNRRITIWAEITSQLTQVSYSKGHYVHIGFKGSEDVTINFTFDNAIDYGEFTHRAWVTYIEYD